MSRPQRIRYRHLTFAERQVLCNGCGPKGGWIPVPEFVFTTACNQHDFNYWIGCHKEHRKKADDQFLEEMIYEADGKWKYIILAHIYYRAVRMFGSKCFHHANRQRTKQDLQEYITELALDAKFGGGKNEQA